jgi:hypothetical protein
VRDIPIALRPLWLALLAFVLITAWPLGVPARAFDGRGAEQVVIPAGQTVDDDLYLMGQNVTVDGTVRGDLVVLAQNLTINGQVEGNLIAVAQTIVLNGIVRDTARVAAQVFLMDGGGRVGRDVIAAGYSAEIRPGSTVGRDFGIGASQAVIAGRIQRNVHAGVDAMEISGNVGGDVRATIPSRPSSVTSAAFNSAPPPVKTAPVVRPGLTVTESARIDGRLLYESPREYPIGGRVGQEVKWSQMAADEVIEPGPFDVAISIVLDILRKTVAIAVVGLLLLWLAPRGLALIGHTIQARPGPSTGWGFLIACAAVLAIFGLGFGIIIFVMGFSVITLFSLAGLVFLLGLLCEVTLIVGLAVITGLVAQAIVSYQLGRLLLERTGHPIGERDVPPLFVGALLFAVITAIPVFGGVIGLVTAFATLGAAWLIVRGERMGGPLTTQRGAGPALAPAPAE